MKASAPDIPVDPDLAAKQALAQQQTITNLQTEAQGDTASIMARYGAKVALAGTGTGTPATSPAAAAFGARV